MLTAREIGQRIAAARKNKDVSQAQVATHLAVSPQAVGKWERGESLPDIITLDRLAFYLGLSLDAFSEHSAEGLAPESSMSAVPSKEECSSQDSGSDDPSSVDDQDSTKATPPPKWDFSHGDWRDGDFSGLNNLADQLKGSNIKNCKFVGSELSGLELYGSSVTDSSFSEADLSDALFKGCSVVRSSFDRTQLKQAFFKGSSAVDCSFEEADLSGALFDGSSLKRCNMQGALLKSTVFKAAQLVDITLGGTVDSCVFDNCSYSNTEFVNARLVNTFFKGSGIKKLRLINCTTDSLTYAFLKSAKVDLDNVTIVD